MKMLSVLALTMLLMFSSLLATPNMDEAVRPPGDEPVTLSVQEDLLVIGEAAGFTMLMPDAILVGNEVLPSSLEFHNDSVEFDGILVDITGITRQEDANVQEIIPVSRADFQVTLVATLNAWTLYESTTSTVLRC